MAEREITKAVTASDNSHIADLSKEAMITNRQLLLFSKGSETSFIVGYAETIIHANILYKRGLIDFQTFDSVIVVADVFAAIGGAAGIIGAITGAGNFLSPSLNSRAEISRLFSRRRSATGSGSATSTRSTSSKKKSKETKEEEDDEE